MLTLKELLATPDEPMSANWEKHFDRCARAELGMETIDELERTPGGAREQYTGPEHVYFIQDSTGLVKIGKARDIYKRMGSYRTHNPSFTIIGIIPNANEKEIHKALGDLRVQGEWFRAGSGRLKELFIARGGMKYKDFCKKYEGRIV